jgi:hypothetical protein
MLLFSLKYRLPKLPHPLILILPRFFSDSDLKPKGK